MNLRPYWKFSFTRENAARQISLHLNLPPQSPAAAIELFDWMNVCVRDRKMFVSILDGRTPDIRPLRTGQVVHSQFEWGNSLHDFLFVLYQHGLGSLNCPMLRSQHTYEPVQSFSRLT